MLHSVGSVLLPSAVEYVLCLGQVVDLAVVAPAVGGEYQGGHEIQFAVGSRTLGLRCAVGCKAPPEITLHRAVLVLHILLGPSPYAVEDVLLVQLYGYHHAVGLAFGADVIVLDIGHIAERVAYLEIAAVRSEKHFLEHFLELLLNFGRGVAHFHEHVAVLSGLETALVPRLLQAGLTARSQYHQGCGQIQCCLSFHLNMVF